MTLRDTLRNRERGGGGDDGSEGSKDGSSDFGKVLSTCRSGIEELVKATVQGTVNTLGLDPDGRQRGDLEPVFDRLLRRAVDLVEEMSASDTEVHRTALKAQATTFKMKMQASRTAASVTMSNQAAELQASFTQKLTQKMNALQSAGGSELAEALERQAELQGQLEEATRNVAKSDEMLKTLRSLLRQKEAEAEAALKESSRLKEEFQEVKTSSVNQSRRASAEINSLQAALLEATSEAERAAMQKPELCKELVTALAGRLRAELEAEGKEPPDSRLSRVLGDMESMSKKIADFEGEIDKRMASTKKELATVRKDADDALKELAALKSSNMGSTAGMSEMQQKLQATQGEVDRLKADLDEARNTINVKQGDVVDKTEEADSLRRDLAEMLARAFAEAQRAAMLEPDECKRQVEAMAQRLESEMEAAKRSGREGAHDQLSRILSELALLTKQLTEAELKASEANSGNATADQVAAKLRKLEHDERKTRETLEQALREVEIKTSQNAQLSDQLKQLLNHYRKVQQESNSLRFSLDRSLNEVALTVGENMNLTDKLKKLLDQHKSTRDEVVACKRQLEGARAEAGFHQEELAALRDRCSQLLEQYKVAYDKEQQLRTTVKQQHASLHAAYLRVKDAELELKRSQGAAVEERDALVQTALHALNTLRVHLGAIHALRPEVTKPIDEVRGVPRAAFSDLLAPFCRAAFQATSQSSPHFHLLIAGDCDQTGHQDFIFSVLSECGRTRLATQAEHRSLGSIHGPCRRYGCLFADAWLPSRSFQAGAVSNVANPTCGRHVSKGAVSNGHDDTRWACASTQAGPAPSAAAAAQSKRSWRHQPLLAWAWAAVLTANGACKHSIIHCSLGSERMYTVVKGQAR